MGWTSFLAIGDSFTEGLNDPGPAGNYRGWADRLAELMAVQQPALRYANLAIRGKYLHQIIEDQLPVALAERPDLVTFSAGGNA
jgi:lysophospholipase L1-like esterase